MTAFGRPPVFIVGSPKAGTTLLRTLFDSHPDVVTYPFEPKIFRHWSVPTAFPARRLALETDPGAVARSWLQNPNLEEFLSPGSHAGRLVPYAGDEIAERLRSELAPLSQVSSIAELVVSIFAALANATSRRLGEMVALDKTPLQEEFAPLLASWFPEARFIHVVRHPTANLVALRLRERSRKLLDLRAIIDQLHLSHLFGRRNVDSLEHYRIVRYEDLVTDPESTMRSLAQHAGIGWHATLLAPTDWGRPWGGNSMHGVEFSGIDSAPLHLWRERARPIDHAFVEATLGWVCRIYDYDPVETTRLASLRPVPGENPVSYLDNRLALAVARRRDRESAVEPGPR